MRGAVASADHGMGMNLGLSVFEGNVADQGKQFDLLAKRDRWLVLLRFPIEPSELHR
jgi:hypothetical protein